MKLIFLLPAMILLTNALLAQSVGIGTTTPNPTAVLHVNAGTSLTNGLLITGTFNANATIPNLSAGSRLMFFPGKGAFRAGYVDDTQWNDNNTGLGSVAFGQNTVASGYGSTAFGVNSTASGSYALVMGQNVSASGSNATAIGVLSKASGEESTALGGNTKASGLASTAMGSTTIASGDFSTAMGIGTEASGSASTAMGYKTIASGPAATSIGYETVAKAIGGVAIGQYNDATDAPSQTNVGSNDRLFQIGNGTLSNTRSNAVTILRNGNVGIGSDVLAPAYRLDINGRMRIRSGGTAGTSAGFWLNKNDNSGLLGFVGVDGNNDIGIFSSASNWSFLVNTTNGNAWVKGVVTANGVTLTSDERLKKDITPLGDAMPLLEKLNAYQYHWKDETWDATLQTGLLAQEVEKVLPDLVKTDDKGMKSVNYIGLVPYMLEAAKEQQSTILEQQSTILQLQSQLNKLTQLVEQLVKK